MKHLNRELVRDRMSEAAKRARANHLRPTTMNNEVWDEAFGQGGFDMHDGWARCFSVSKTGILHVFKRVRVAEEWMAPLSKEAKVFKEMAKWPHSTMPKQNPWRTTFFPLTVVSAPEWDQGKQQFKVTFDCKPEVTYWFADEYIKASHLEGWLIPRKQRATIPWEKEGGILKPPPPPKAWVPHLNSEERQWLIDGDTSRLIRKLHERYSEELKDKRLCIMDIKDVVDRMIEGIKE